MSSEERVRWVAFDNTSPDVVYQGTWFTRENATNVGTFGDPYLGTQHGTNTSGSYLTFSYAGSQFEVLGTRSDRNDDGESPVFYCSMDGGEDAEDHLEGQFKPMEAWNLCNSFAGQTDGFHTARMDIGKVPANTTVWIDQIRVKPSLDTTITSTKPLVVIEQDDPAVEFNAGEWEELGGKAVMTRKAGSTMMINFSGTKATWVGWTLSVGQAPARATYILDGMNETTFSIPTTPGSSPTFRKVLFETGGLRAGEHSLYVTHQTDGVPLVFDHLLVENGDINLPERRQPTTSSRAVPMPSESSLNTDSAGVKINVGAIVGSVLGGLVALAIFACLLLFFKRRKQQRSAEVARAEQGVRPVSAQINPFPVYVNSTLAGPVLDIGYDGSRSSVNLREKCSSALLAETPSSPVVSSVNTFSPLSLHTLSTINSSYYGGPADPSTTTLNVGLPSIPSTPQPGPPHSANGRTLPPRITIPTGPSLVRHQDSGLRLQTPNMEVVEIPPSYAPF